MSEEIQTSVLTSRHWKLGKQGCSLNSDIFSSRGLMKVFTKTALIIQK